MNLKIISPSAMLNKLTISLLLSFFGFQICAQHKTQTIQENHSFISRVYAENGVTYIDADYVQFFTGNIAIEKAKKNGDADVRIVDGQKIYSVPNDFYIVNENKKIRKLALTKDVKLNLVDDCDLKEIDAKSILNDFKNNHIDQLYLLKLENEKVVEIKEIFTP